MRAPAVSAASKIAATLLAALMMLTVVPIDAFATGEGSETEGSGSDVILGEGIEGPEGEEPDSKPLTLASGLIGAPSNFINSDVALDSEPVIGSFTVDGLTFAVIDGPYVELVGVSSDWQQVMSSQEREDSGVASMLASRSDGADPGAAALTLPETVSYAGVSHIVSSIGAYAFYLSGVTSVTLPASISNVDDRAFRSSDVASVLVADDNPTYSSFDGALYDAERLSLLLIPEGKQGAVLLPKTAEVAEASVFSHCPLVDSISVEKDGAAFASENGLLYTSDLTTLLRVPVGATEIAIREGCTTIAAGALEACAKLTTINAPASVTSISPDVFHAIPTVSLPATSLTEGAPQLTAIVALSTVDDDPVEVDLDGITVVLPEEAISDSWMNSGFSVTNRPLGIDARDEPVASGQTASVYAARTNCYLGVNIASGGSFKYHSSKDLGSSLNNFNGTALDIPLNTYSGQKLTIFGYADSTFGFYDGKTIGSLTYARFTAVAKPGYLFKGWSTSKTGSPVKTYSATWETGSRYLYAIFQPIAYKITLDAQEADPGCEGTQTLYCKYNTTVAMNPDYTNSPTDANPIVIPRRKGHVFMGYFSEPNGQGIRYFDGYGSRINADGSYMFTSSSFTVDTTFYAQWEPATYDVVFDVDSEPVDPAKPSTPIDPQAIKFDSGRVALPTPTRPGYAFLGWVPRDTAGMLLPNDTALLKQDPDGSWTLDAAQLPAYADNSGTVRLVARWSASVSVDAPLSATFLYDLAEWDGTQARDAWVEGASAFENHGSVAVRACGLTSERAAGAAILKKPDGTTLADAPKGDSTKALSVFPSARTPFADEDDAKAPATDKPGDDLAHRVEFALDEIVPEAAFDASAWSISASGERWVVFRLNLGGSSGLALDRDALIAATEGNGAQAATIAQVTWCFALA